MRKVGNLMLQEISSRLEKVQNNIKHERASVRIYQREYDRAKKELQYLLDLEKELREFLGEV